MDIEAANAALPLLVIVIDALLAYLVARFIHGPRHGERQSQRQDRRPLPVRFRL